MEKIYYTKDLPEFFLIHKSVDEDGNLNSITSVACNHRVSVYTHNTRPDVPMVYAWSKGETDDIEDWIWTDMPAFSYEPCSDPPVISKEARQRLESMGYRPVLYTSSNTTTVGPDFHVYAKLGRQGSLDRGCDYIEYLENGETYLKHGEHPKIITISGVYERLAIEAGRTIKEDHRRKEYIFGLEHLFGRLHYSKGDAIKSDAVLILTNLDTDSYKRIDVIHKAIAMGFNPDDLTVLIRMMANGYVVFDTHYAAYGLERVYGEKHGYRPFFEQVWVTDNEFYEVYGYKTSPERSLHLAKNVYSACNRARDLGWHLFSGAIESIPDERLVRVEH